MAGIFKYITCINQDCKKRSTVTTETKKTPKCPKCRDEMKYARKWTYRFMYEYNTYKKTEFENKRDTQKAMEDHRRELETGIVPESKTKRYTFDELAEMYKLASQSESAYQNKEYMVNKLKERYGKKFIHTFNALDIEQLKAHYIKQASEGLATAYIVCLKNMIMRAIRWEMVSKDVYEKLKDVKSKVYKTRIRYLTPEERIALKDACADHLKPMVILALNTGMRKGEIFNLQWHDIDLKNKLIWIKEQKNDSLDAIPINQTALHVLTEMVRRLDTPYVFFNKKGGKRTSIQNSFKGALQRAKIEDFRFHDLRHDFASNLIQRGVHLKQIQDLMRHKKIEMTLKYAHLAPGGKADAVALLDEGNETPLPTVDTLQAKIKELEKELTEKVA